MKEKVLCVSLRERDRKKTFRIINYLIVICLSYNSVSLNLTRKGTETFLINN